MIVVFIDTFKQKPWRAMFKVGDSKGSTSQEGRPETIWLGETTLGSHAKLLRNWIPGIFLQTFAGWEENRIYSSTCLDEKIIYWQSL